jgi:hypothetical protein
MKLQRALVSRALVSRRAWQLAELAATEQNEGQSTHWHMRQVVLASQEWVLAEVGHAPPKVRERRREAFDDAYNSAKHHLESGDVDGVRMAESFLSSIGAVAAQSGEDSLRWHNDSVVLFNKIVVTGSPGQR